MITLDTDLYLIYSLFNVSPKKVSDQYFGMSIEQIMEAEAASGNAAAARFDKEILSDPIKLLKAFKLDDIGNKFAILNSMNEHDLKELLPLLDAKDLQAGLSFFTKDKLLNLVEALPKEQLVNMTLQMFSPEQLMELMPERQLNKFLSSTDLDPSMIQKHLKDIPPAVLAQMIESVTGKLTNGAQNQGMESQAGSSDQGGAGSQAGTSSIQFGIDGQPKGLEQQGLIAQLNALPADKFQEALLNMPPKSKRNFILMMTKEDPNLLKIFDASAYTNIIARKEKSEMVKASSAISADQLVKMIGQLPKDLMAAVATQIDPEKFANVLIKSFKDILGQIIAA